MPARSRLFLLSLVFAATSAAWYAAAQTVSARGSGTYRAAGKTSELSNVEIRFVDEDRFVLTMTTTSSRTIELRGRYSGRGHHRDIRVHRDSKHDDTIGYGEIELSNNKGELRSVTAHGEGDGDSFKLTFNAKGGGGGGDPDKDDRHSFSDNVKGTGLFEVGDHQKRITHLRVDMNRNGDLHLHGEGPGLEDTAWEGRWSGNGPEYSIDLRHSGNYGVHSSGTLTLSKNNKAFKSLTASGKFDGKPFRLTFAAE